MSGAGLDGVARMGGLTTGALRRMFEPLTPTELAVLAYLPLRVSTEQIAACRGVAVTTVRTHVRNIQRKLHASSCWEAVVVAERLALLDHDAVIAAFEELTRKRPQAACVPLFTQTA